MSKSIKRNRTSRINPNSKTQQYLKQVAINVASQGAPSDSGNYLATMATRVKAEIQKSVPSNFRLPVRMAIRSYVKQLNAAVKGI